MDALSPGFAAAALAQQQVAVKTIMKQRDVASQQADALVGLIDSAREMAKQQNASAGMGGVGLDVTA